MILKKSKDRKTYYNERRKEKWAILPTKMKRDPEDVCGEWIWLEKYIEKKRFARHIGFSKGRFNKLWKVFSRLTIKEAFLQELEEQEQFDKCKDDAPQGYTVGMGQAKSSVPASRRSY